MPVRRWGVSAALLTLAAGAAAPADDKQAAEFVGRTEAVATVELRARVDGYVVRVNCKDGDAVKQGGLLVEIDPRPYQAELDRARAGILQAEARVKWAHFEQERARRLFPTGGISQGELQQRDAEAATADANLLTAKANTELAKLNVEFTHVTAPIAGRVTHLLSPGNDVRADRYALGTLVADDPIAVVFDVDEKTTLRLLKAGPAAGGSAAVGFADETGYPHEGKVDSVAVQADPKSGAVRWRVLLPNADRRVLPGMSARVRLAARH
jgi:RND family efflux transporter MFP subunit